MSTSVLCCVCVYAQTLRSQMLTSVLCCVCLRPDAAFLNFNQCLVLCVCLRPDAVFSNVNQCLMLCVYAQTLRNSYCTGKAGEQASADVAAQMITNMQTKAREAEADLQR